MTAFRPACTVAARPRRYPARMIPWPPKPPSLIPTRPLSPSSTVVISAGLPSRARRSRLLRLVDERLPEQLRERGPLLLDELPDDDLLSEAEVELLQRREVPDDGVLPVVAELGDGPPGAG